MKVKQILREIVDKTRARERSLKTIYLIALIPTLIFSIFVILNPTNWDIPHLILLPFGIAGFYIIMIMAILDIIFGYSIYEVLLLPKVNLWNNKIKRISNTPNRIDELERTIKSNVNPMDHNLAKILQQISEDYKNLDNKKMPEIITDIHKELAVIREALKLNQYQCPNCKKFFEAKGPDDIFTVAMRERCSVCDILNMDMFRRWDFDCEYCGTINYIFWHHKDGHTNAEVRIAEKKRYDSDESA